MEEHGTPDSPVTHRFSHDNLHISLQDPFGPSQADAVIALLYGNQHASNAFLLTCAGFPGRTLPLWTPENSLLLAD